MLVCKKSDQLFLGAFLPWGCAFWSYGLELPKGWRLLFYFCVAISEDYVMALAVYICHTLMISMTCLWRVRLIILSDGYLIHIIYCWQDVDMAKANIWFLSTPWTHHINNVFDKCIFCVGWSASSLYILFNHVKEMKEINVWLFVI